MGNRWLRQETYSPYVNPVDICFGFQNNAAASPTIFYSKGPYGAAAAPLHPIIASVVRTGVGLFTVTFADAWPMLTNCSVFQQGLITSTAQITAVANVGGSSAVTMNITTMTSAAAADIAAGANNICWIYAQFLNTWSQ